MANYLFVRVLICIFIFFKHEESVLIINPDRVSEFQNYHCSIFSYLYTTHSNDSKDFNADIQKLRHKTKTIQ